METTISWIQTSTAGFWQVYMLGVAMILSGPFSDWNHGFVVGFGGYMVVYAIIVLGYAFLIFSLAEMASTVAFASGAYGYVRCTIGPMYGFLVGCCELIENNFITLCCAYTAALSVTAATEMDRKYEPLWLFLIYLVTLAVLLPGGKYFWHSMFALFAFTMTTLFLYLFTMWVTQPKIWTADLTHAKHNKFLGGPASILQQLFRPTWFYIGIECITVTGKNMSDGTKVLPKALMAIFFTVFLMCTSIMLTTAAYFQEFLDVMSWKDMALNILAPLAVGYQDGLKMGVKAVNCFTTISSLGSVLGFHYTSTHIMQAMALSGLLPPILKRWSGPNKVPVNALVFSAMVQYAILMIGWSVSTAPPFFTVCILSSCFVYFGTLGAFLSFRYRFGHMPRSFTSPTGLFGGICGIIVFAFVFMVVSIVNIEDQAIYYFLGYMFACFVYYILVAEKRQFFSPEEQKRFLKAYILNAKTKKAASYTVLERIYLTFNCLAMTENSSRRKSKNSKTSSAMSKNKPTAPSTALSTSPINGNGVPNAAICRLIALSDPPKLNSVAPAESFDRSMRAEPIVTSSSRCSVKVSVAPVLPGNQNMSDESGRHLNWSGKVLDNAESVKFLAMMTSTKCKEDVLSAFPELLLSSTIEQEEPV